MASRPNINIAELAARPSLVLGWGLVGLLGLIVMWFMWPLVILTSLLGGSYWLWKQQQIQQARQDKRQNRLNHKFYELLQHRQGRVSALELAMYSRINGAEARRYLHQQAQALGAYFERTVNGDIIYIFNLAAMYDSQPITPAEVAWAHAERERIRVQHQLHQQVQQHRTVQANAKQIQALRQLSQRNPAMKSAEIKHLAPSQHALDAQAAIDQPITIDVSAANG